MTTNERLFEAGLFEEFYRAFQAIDRKRMLTILDKVDMPGELGKVTVDQMLAHPERYGPQN
jgi:hypothetical protein